jgi:hypothetical protein
MPSTGRMDKFTWGRYERDATILQGTDTCNRQRISNNKHLMDAFVEAGNLLRQKELITLNDCRMFLQRALADIYHTGPAATSLRLISRKEECLSQRVPWPNRTGRDPTNGRY